MTLHAERVQSLWDELAEFPAAQTDQAFLKLLETICDLFGAWNASWMAAVRMQDLPDQDPVGGWRPREAGYLHETAAIEAARLAQYRRLESGQVDPTIVANIKDAGRWRAHRAIDLIGPEWFESEVYQQYFLATDRADIIWVGCPVNEDLEIFIGVFRRASLPRFTVDERDGVLAALRGLKWFFRRHLLSHGLMVADAPLTPTEREVLKALLAGASKEQFAAETNRSPHTVHHHCKALYQKFGVKNRSSLMALWLGRPAE